VGRSSGVGLIAWRDRNAYDKRVRESSNRATLPDAALDVGEDVWISFVIRDNQLVPVGGATSLRAGDEMLALTDPERGPDLGPIFSKPGTGPASA
jgi:NhaP-type Na+/H+ and K+/H+ antiporter